MVFRKEKSMSFLQKNLEAISHCIYNFQEFYEKCKKGKINRIEILQGRDNSNVIRVSLEDGRKVALNSLYNGQREIEQWANQISFDNTHIYMIFGLSNGEQIRYLLKYMNQESRVIIYEPNKELFLTAIEKIDYSDIFYSNKCLIAVNGINQFQFEDIFSSLVGWSNREFVQYVASIRYDSLYFSEYKEFIAMIRDEQEKLLMKRNTELCFASQYFDAVLFNLQYLYQSYSSIDLKDKFPEDYIGIVVSSGPSLKKNIKLLKKMKNKAFILACDSAVKYLIKEEIVPDAFVNLDVNKKIDFDYKDIDECPVFLSLDSSITMIEKVTGKKIFYHAANEYYENICEKFQEEYYIVDTGGSVACNAFDILRMMGCKTIVLVGQDLAFTGDELYPGIKRNEVELYKNRELEEVEGVNGDTVYTDRVFTRYRRWFEEKIEQYKEEITVIDATEGGAKIKGSTIMTLQEVANTYCKAEYEFTQLFSDLPIHFQGKQGKEYIQWILASKGRLNQLERDVNRAVDLCNRFKTLVLREHRDDKEMKKIIKELGELIKKIEKVPEKSLVMLNIAETEYLAMERLEEKQDTLQEEQLTLIERNLMLYEGMKESVKYTKEKMESVYNRFHQLEENI